MFLLGTGWTRQNSFSLDITLQLNKYKEFSYTVSVEV